MPAVPARNAALRQRLQLLVRGRREYDERREKLLEDVPVRLEQEGEEFLQVVSDQVELHARANARQFERVACRIQAEDLAYRQYMRAAQVVVRVGRGEAVQVRAAHGSEEQRVGLLLRHGEQYVREHHWVEPTVHAGSAVRVADAVGVTGVAHVV